MSTTSFKKSSKGGATMKAASECCDANVKVAPRDRIVSTARDLFRQHGIRGIGVDAIAEAASTNKMTLYRHFGSKDDLICETLKAVSSQACALWTELATTLPGNPRGQLDLWVDRIESCVLTEPHGCDMANAAVELKEAGHPAHEVIEAFKADQRARLTDLCREAGVSEPELLADTLLMLLEGARVSRQAVGAEGPAKRFREACQKAIAIYSA
ncbi:TetR/AcrR family transcriptional regulator [Rhizobium sp. YIM 134829]|uniref:TetR/AcrR family transcriptional regulator n=1 Tax=Rhizobium sp. YIM 134829 TaxID=3390453 RepID=UPI00397B512D